MSINHFCTSIISNTVCSSNILGLHNVAASCAILVILIFCACTFVGIAVGILHGVVLATMTAGIIYLVAGKSFYIDYILVQIESFIVFFPIYSYV